MFLLNKDVYVQFHIVLYGGGDKFWNVGITGYGSSSRQTNIFVLNMSMTYWCCWKDPRFMLASLIVFEIRPICPDEPSLETVIR